MNLVLLVTFAILFLLILGAAVLGLRVADSRRKRRVAAILQSPAEDLPVAETSLLSARGDTPPLLARLLEGLNLGSWLELRIQQAGMSWTVQKYAGLTLGLAAAGALLGFKLTVLVSPQLSSLALAVVGLLIPYGILNLKRTKRLSSFEEQFPEALDFLSRAMRAGHAFSVSLELLADESPAPLGVEFRKVFSEQNLGSPLDATLRNLADRVPLVDVSFFVSAVLLQRETGGNLSEILNRLSGLIRERFQLKGHVKATSASAKMTGVVLTLLPLGLAFMLNAINPGYLQGMINDPAGQNMLIAAVVAQLFGFLVIRKIVDIQV
jgi:tight adherence protein B